VAGGFCQLGHGKAAPVKRLAPGDWIAYYSPRTALESGEPVQAFTAIGRIKPGEPYQVDMGGGFHPTRRDVDFQKRATEAPIRPLLDRLSFTRDKPSWGYAFRRGSFAVSAEDFRARRRSHGVKAKVAAAAKAAGREEADMTAWSATQYVKFEDERSRPAAELLARVPLDRPRRVIDIGSGPATPTELLAARFPGADVIGLDSSPEMLTAARKRLPKVGFHRGGRRRWTPEPAADLLFSNATFQWVTGHLAVLARLVGTLPSGGVLALQMPDNLTEPTHMLMRDVALAGPWRDKFATPICARRNPAGRRLLQSPQAARRPGRHLDHDLQSSAGEAPPRSSTGSAHRPPPIPRPASRPTRSAPTSLNMRRGWRRRYPALVDGRVLLRFPRLFMVAVRT